MDEEFSWIHDSSLEKLREKTLEFYNRNLVDGKFVSPQQWYGREAQYMIYALGGMKNPPMDFVKIIADKFWDFALGNMDFLLGMEEAIKHDNMVMVDFLSTIRVHRYISCNGVPYTSHGYELACRYNRLDIVMFFVKKGVKDYGIHHEYNLLCVISNGYIDNMPLIKYLVENLDVKKDLNGHFYQSFIAVCRRCDRYDILNYLIEEGLNEKISVKDRIKFFEKKYVRCIEQRNLKLISCYKNVPTVIEDMIKGYL